MQGLKSDIDVISVSGPSLKCQYGEGSATESSANGGLMDGSTGRAWGQINQDLLAWLSVENSQEMSHRVRGGDTDYLSRQIGWLSSGIFYLQEIVYKTKWK